MHLEKLSKEKALRVYVIVYLISFVIGFFVFWNTRLYNLPLWFGVWMFDLSATLFIWIVGLAIKNASIYDPYWSVLPPVLLLLFVFSYQIPLSIYGVILIFAVLVWSVRLTYNFVINFDGFKYLDWRYKMLKEKSPKIWFFTNLFGINLMPTVIVFIQLIAPLREFTNEVTNISFFLIGVLVMVISAFLQLISDKQMRSFRLQNSSEKKCMREGLWAYSRHPNYCGEVMFWWGLYITSLSVDGVITIAIFAPILMTGLFIFISIPMMEKKILLTRPEYEIIQNEISMFIPLPTRKSNNEEVESNS